MSAKKLVIGILAHVDAGKTTLSEGLLYKAGEIRRLGRVDHRDAFLDTHAIEREKGITIFSKQAVLHFGDVEITLLDTPGHVDFSTETERTLSVLDYAILVISGTDGVQNHTETLWRLLSRYKVPVFVFINKMDISRRTREELVTELNNRLGHGFVDFSGDGGENFSDALAMCDDIIMERFLETGEIPNEEIIRAVSERKIFPCCFGSALKMYGIDEFIQTVLDYTRRVEYKSEFGARVFKISEDEQGSRLAHMKITGGRLKVREAVLGEDWEEKATQIRIYSGSKYKSIDEAEAGTVCAVTGLSCVRAGEGLGFEKDAFLPLLEPVLSYRIELPPGSEPHTVLQKLRRLEQEEPELNVMWDERHREIYVRLMGEVQLEVLGRLIKDRFGMEVGFGKGSIAYKETIASPAEGVGHYEPLRHYAEVHLLLEPGKPGSGLIFSSDCSEDVLDKNWQRLIMTHLHEKQHLGVLTGSPITDMKITLIAGRAHKKHTEGGDFRQATYRAVRQGLKSAESVLLEPWYSFRLEVPAENIGKAMTDLQRIGAEFTPPETDGENAVIKGSAPVSAMRDYPSEMIAYTRGKGRLSCILKGYEPCLNAKEVIESIGYDSEADLENPADSVFCSGGAGFTVKWDKVRDYMHVESGFSFGGDSARTERKMQSMAMDYVSRVADDEELIKIFERTYGPIRRDITQAVRTRREPAENGEWKAKKAPTGPEYLLVDGYNVIFAWDELREISENSLEDARTALIDILSNYKGFCQREIIVVFDAYRVKGSRREVERVGNIDVVYTKEAETADMYIEKVTHELSKNHRVRVATSDNLEQVIILGGGALRMSAAELRAEVMNAEAAIREILRRAEAEKPVEHIKIEKG